MGKRNRRVCSCEVSEVISYFRGHRSPRRCLFTARIPTNEFRFQRPSPGGAIIAIFSDRNRAHRARTMTVIDSAYRLGVVAAPLVAVLRLGGFGVTVMPGVRAAAFFGFILK